jgi:hypothetical protein
VSAVKILRKNLLALAGRLEEWGGRRESKTP